ncbi:MAG: response regulator [Thermoanaerobaculia bacterium]|nr:response regulator [Thermoanaerobaculia bacterium]
MMKIQEETEIPESPTSDAAPVDESSLNILIVEDDPTWIEVLTELLEEQRQSDGAISRVSRLSEARARLADRSPDVILLDLNLADSKGLETV